MICQQNRKKSPIFSQNNQKPPSIGIKPLIDSISLADNVTPLQNAKTKLQKKT